MLRTLTILLVLLSTLDICSTWCAGRIALSSGLEPWLVEGNPLQSFFWRAGGFALVAAVRALGALGFLAICHYGTWLVQEGRFPEPLRKLILIVLSLGVALSLAVVLSNVLNLLLFH